MSHDVTADALNKIMNGLRAKHTVITVKRSSKFLLSVLAIAKLKGYVKSYKVESGILTIELGKIHGCQSIKPRFLVKVTEIEKYVKRYLPSKDIGTIIISTSKGPMTHQTAQEKNMGGSLIAYFF